MGRFRTREVAAGEVLVDEGRPVDGLFVVLHGSYEVTRMEHGARKHVARLSEGELFGEQSLLRGGAAGATCTSRSRGMVLRLPRESFEQLTREHPALRAYLEELDGERRRSCG
jgi:CRP-like cAMP-binding protein